jgi:two-component system, chemotaxis family, chemotaxis protein CheY
MITDLDMPGLDGLQLVNRIRSQPEHRMMPIIMLSQRGDARLQEGQMAGISTMVIKPFHAQQIVTTVESLLGSLGNH